MTLLYTDPLFLKHETGNHPERPARLRSITERLEKAGLPKKCTAGTYQPLAEETIAKVRAYNQKQAEHDRLDLEKKLAEKTYSEVVGRYEGARLQVAARSAQLQVIDPAVVPSRPISRQVVSKTVTALFAGFAVSAVCALAFGLSRERLASR